ncbi:hypothetical protein CSQ96_03460 [Janthinobacterium sp. BJB412]|nr:hypothetical protein CSQ96_03460 [Janthinobacterium sp. BJB412]
MEFTMTHPTNLYSAVAAEIDPHRQDELWRAGMLADMNAEYNRSGKITGFFQEVLAHFSELPAEEQAQYPEGYAEDLQHKIALDYNYRDGGIGGNRLGRDVSKVMYQPLDALNAIAPRKPLRKAA